MPCLIESFILILPMKGLSRINPLSANPTKWSNTLKKFVGKLSTNCLSVFDHFVGLVLKGLSLPKSINPFMHNVEKWPNVF